MIRERTDEQVTASARQIDTARQAGITDDQLVELVTARAAWHSTGRVRPILLTPTLMAAAGTPAALAWDGVFTAALRRTIRKLSDPRPSV